MISSQPPVRTGTSCHAVHLVKMRMCILTIVLVVVTQMTATTVVVSSFRTLPTTGRHRTIPHQSNSITTTTALCNSGGILSDFFNAGKNQLMKSMAGEYDSTAVQEQIQTYIQNNPVLMFSFDTCPYCIKAKSILDSKNIQYVSMVHLGCCNKIIPLPSSASPHYTQTHYRHV